MLGRLSNSPSPCLVLCFLLQQSARNNKGRILRGIWNKIRASPLGLPAIASPRAPLPQAVLRTPPKLKVSKEEWLQKHDTSGAALFSDALLQPNGTARTRVPDKPKGSSLEPAIDLLWLDRFATMAQSSLKVSFAKTATHPGNFWIFL